MLAVSRAGTSSGTKVGVVMRREKFRADSEQSEKRTAMVKDGAK